MANEIEILQSWIQNSKKVVFFGGAGVSTESGIPDFRSVDGLYHQEYAYPPETILSHSFFMISITDEFYPVSTRKKCCCLDAKPNMAHKQSGPAGKHPGNVQAVITQNIDGLHQAAGSKERDWNFMEVYCSNYCMKCHKAL